MSVNLNKWKIAKPQNSELLRSQYNNRFLFLNKEFPLICILLCDTTRLLLVFFYRLQRRWFRMSAALGTSLIYLDHIQEWRQLLTKNTYLYKLVPTFINLSASTDISSRPTLGGLSLLVSSSAVIRSRRPPSVLLIISAFSSRLNP